MIINFDLDAVSTAFFIFILSLLFKEEIEISKLKTRVELLIMIDQQLRNQQDKNKGGQE